MRSFDRFTLTTRAALTILLAALSVAAQSASQDYPTPVHASEIGGTIKPRDIGDSRLTSHYYQFEGGQGDLFINLVTRNFTGDIDVFAVSGLRPLTKIVVYGDVTETETGRVLYFRKPEKLILRVQGRTPGDEPASYRIKFAGSFIASTQTAPAEPELPSLTAKNESGIRVNSVGTIVQVIPKATPTPAPVTAAVEEKNEVADPPKDLPISTKTEADETAAKPVDDDAEKKLGVVVTDNIPAANDASPPATRRTARRRTLPRRTATQPAEKPANEPAAETAAAAPPPRSTARRGRARATPAPKEPDPLEKINLVILFKDGTRIEHPMSGVVRFTADKGVLTVIAKDGSIRRFSLLDVQRVTIE